MRRFIQHNLYIVYALSSAMCYAVHNFITANAMARWRNSVTVLFPEWTALILVPALYHLYRAKFLVHPATGRYWCKGHSVFYKEGDFYWPPFWNILARGMTSILVPITIALSTYFSREIGVSPAVVQSFTTLSSFMTAVGFYFSFGERLNLKHILGMLMIVGSVIIVAISKSVPEEEGRNTQ